MSSPSPTAPVSSFQALGLACYTAVAVLVIRRAYQALPAWAKRKNNDENYEPDAIDNVANPLTILSNMRDMMKLCQDRVDDDLPWFKVHACFLAFLQLQNELKLA